jgi:16S rRNA (cytidine1402-2'-O)-methyltransferase
MTTLYVMATPIGNLKDITFRAIEILRTVDLILCEDTRVTSKLLTRYEIKKPLLSYHQHSKLQRINEIADQLTTGKNLALLTDAGTPGISDPGNKLISEVLKKTEGVRIVPIPGPSAVTTALSVSGLKSDEFLFLGFLPRKKDRARVLQEIAENSRATLFYESTHRIIKTLEQLESLIPERQVVLARELTKLHETIYRGTAVEVLEQLKNSPQKGEFVVIINGLK